MGWCTVFCNRNCFYSWRYDPDMVIRCCVRETIYISKNGRCLTFSRKPKKEVKG